MLTPEQSVNAKLNCTDFVVIGNAMIEVKGLGVATKQKGTQPFT